MNRAKDNQGFSLIELIVTLAISSILLLGTINVLVNNMNMSRANDRYARLNESSLLAMNFITQDLQTIGYTGCAKNINTTIPFASNGDLLHLLADDGNKNILLSIDGLDDSNSIWTRSTDLGGATTQIQGSIAPGTDAITLRKVRNLGAMLTNDMASGADDLTVNLSDDNIRVDDIFVIHDCLEMEIARVTGIDAGTNTIKHTGLDKAYTTDEMADNILSTAARVAMFDVVRYYIGTDENNQRGLWREVLPGNTPESRQELIKGVENMQILYGVTSNSNNFVPDFYVTANQLVSQGAWQDVVSVKVAMLVSSNFISTAGDDSLQNEERLQEFLDYKNAQIALGAKHELLDKNIANGSAIDWVADGVLRQVITREVFFRNRQYDLSQ